MSPCGCTYQDAHCVEGKRLLAAVVQAYQRLTDRPRGEGSPARQEQMWHAYEQARYAYFEHLGEAGKLRCAYCGERSLNLVPCFLCGCLCCAECLWLGPVGTYGEVEICRGCVGK